MLNNKEILAIADAHGVTAGQVVLRWAVQSGQARNRGSDISGGVPADN